VESGGAFSAIGPHLRHCLDHISCFAKGLPTGVIEYDARERDPRMESEFKYFHDACKASIDMLATLDAAALTRVVHVRQIPAPGRAQVTVQSSVERELLFLSGHTVHHCAIITQIAQANGIALCADHAVAFSTAAHFSRTTDR